MQWQVLVRQHAPRPLHVRVASPLRASHVAGFRVSRSKMMDLVKAGSVRVNWKPVTKPSVEVKAGDVLSCADKGRVEIKSVELTKKAKYVVCMVRFV
jgi:RNA-binding protein YlmH